MIRALEEQGVLKIESEQVYRNPVKQAKKSQQEIIYTEEQQYVIQGSGKTICVEQGELICFTE